MRKFALLILVFSLVTTRVQASSSACDQVIIEINGTAKNFTAGNVASSIDGWLQYDGGNLFSGQLNWDNISLFGSAQFSGGKIDFSEQEKTLFEFFGTFECGGVGGWPEGTSSRFKVVIHLDKRKNTMKASYTIIGEGRLPRQYGALYFSNDFKKALLSLVEA